jgi:hypothetical protein
MNEKKKILNEYIFNEMPRILSLLDRNKYSDTYGCFDREYWHYRSKNFFNGMSQSYIYSLSLIYTTNFEKNYLYQDKNLKNLIIAVLNFSINNIHRDGSFDEHYYNEHSIIATSMALYSITESILLLNIDSTTYHKSLRQIAKFLIKNKEYFVRSNHIACKLLAIHNVYLLTKEEFYNTSSLDFLNLLIENKSKEGWFKEYEGCDIGYLTFTLYFLTKYAIKCKNDDIIKIVKECINFCSYFLHPDLSFGGFYGSRETMHFLPYPFEIINFDNDMGMKMVNSYLSSIETGNAEIMSDYRFNFLLFNNFLEIYNGFSENRTNELFIQNFSSKFFEESGLYIFNNETYHVILSLKKGGILYVFKDKELIFRNCGIVGVTNKGVIISTGYKNLVYRSIENGFILKSKFKKYIHPTKFNPYMMILFNFFNLSAGKIRYFRKFIKNVLIKRSILNESMTDVEFELRIMFLDTIQLVLTINKPKKIKFKDLRISSYFPVRFIPSSRFFQKNDLLIKDYSLKKNVSILNKYNSVDIKLNI